MSRPYHTPTVYVVGTYRDAASMLARSLTVHSLHTSHGAAIKTYCDLAIQGHDAKVVETNGALLPGQTFGEVDVEGWDDATPGSTYADVEDFWRLGVKRRVRRLA